MTKSIIKLLRYRKDFLSYAIKRQEILERRQHGEDPPWSDEKIFQDWSFCNIYREDDRTTIWFRENIREPMRNDPNVLLATVAFRWFNRIETGEKIKDMLLAGEWNSDEAKRRLRENKPIVTSAYIIKTPDGMNKLDGVCWCIDNVAKEAKHLATRVEPEYMCLEAMWDALCRYPFMGNFMAYEVVTDLRHTFIGEQAHDIMTWASPGPGCCRGLARVIDGNPDGYQRGDDKYRANFSEMILIMRTILEWVNERWPERWPRWEMREVEHTLCEYDKYKRAQEQEKKGGRVRLKNRFRPVSKWEKTCTS